MAYRVFSGEKRLSSWARLHYIHYRWKEDLEKTKHSKNDNRFVSLCGQLTPLESARLLKKCKFIITNNTEPMHLSYAVGTQTLALFSVRDYSK